MPEILDNPNEGKQHPIAAFCGTVVSIAVFVMVIAKLLPLLEPAGVVLLGSMLTTDILMVTQFVLDQTVTVFVMAIVLSAMFGPSK